MIARGVRRKQIFIVGHVITAARVDEPLVGKSRFFSVLVLGHKANDGIFIALSGDERGLTLRRLFVSRVEMRELSPALDFNMS